MISNRHIRHDWNAWVDSQEQMSVKTLCGVKSRPGLCGIPGVTQQDLVVDKNGKKVWGWCMNCSRDMFYLVAYRDVDLDVAPQAIYDLYDAAARVVAPIAHAYMANQLQAAVRDGREKGAEYWTNHIRHLVTSYP